MGGRLLRPGDQDGCDHADLTVGGTFGGARRPSRHALRSQSKGSGGSASRIVMGRSVVAGLCLSPRPAHRAGRVGERTTRPRDTSPGHCVAVGGSSPSRGASTARTPDRGWPRASVKGGPVLGVHGAQLVTVSSARGMTNRRRASPASAGRKIKTCPCAAESALLCGADQSCVSVYLVGSSEPISHADAPYQSIQPVPGWRTRYLPRGTSRPG